MKNLILVSGDIIENSNKYNVEAIVNTANKYIGVRIDIWTHFMRECIINYVH